MSGANVECAATCSDSLEHTSLATSWLYWDLGSPDEARHCFESLPPAIHFDDQQQDAQAAGGALKHALPPFHQKTPDLSDQAAVGMITLPSQPAEDVNQHTNNQGCHQKLQQEGQQKAVDLLCSVNRT